jgi:hypothetical protein
MFFNYFSKELNIKNLMYLVLYTCLFSEISKIYFLTDYSKYFDLQIKNLVLENLKFNIITSIKKIGILLGGDNWKRVALQDDHEFFSMNKIQEKVPLFIRNLLTIFNKDSTNANKKCISDYQKYLEMFSVTNTNNNNLFNNEIIKFDILSKKIDNKSLIISSSTVTFLKSLLDAIVYFYFFDSLTFEIFINIFNIFDYYILASLNMFVEKKLLILLFEEVNLEEVKKKGKLEQAVETILFQKKFSNLKKFLINTKKNLESLFEIDIDILKNSYEGYENYEISEFHLPKLNNQIIINDNNVYSCMIENIILFESIFSIYKIIKRISHFTKKIELDFQTKIINETIQNYSNVLNELKVFLYRPICMNIFKIDPILNKITNYKWDMKESETENLFSEANQFIDNIFQEMCEKYEKLYLLSGGSLTEKSQKRFFDVIMQFINEKLMDTFAKIKKVFYLLTFSVIHVEEVLC